MRAIIPVAGVGTRLRPHTYTIPKVLLNVAGKTILGHILDKIVEEGIEKATLIVGYLGEMVEEFVKKNYKLDVEFIYQEERKGLGHAVYISEKTFKGDELLIVLGDTVFDVNLNSMLSSKYSALGVKYVEDPRRFGVAVINDNFITKLVEKPEKQISNLAIVGLYYIKNANLLSECLNEIITSGRQTKGEFQLTDALQLMLERGEKFVSFDVEGWYDCGKPETLLSTNHFLLKKLNNHYHLPDVVIINPVYISPVCKIKNSVIGPFTTISDNATIENSIVKNSIIGVSARVENAMIHDSIIGNNSTIKGSYKRLNTGDSSEIEFY
ncbi:MAG: sugar phosphate nucleotidyltransferase [Ignavibacteria bacterium]|nr:sugar phosphate nucleotidyltransferase [Ignavibacteria bacterium]